MTPLPTIVVQSHELGVELSLPELPTISEDARSWLLFRDSAGLTLRRDDGVHIRAEFVHGRSAARAREASLAGQPLAKALGIARLTAGGQRATLVDATAGLGVDAWQAAALGADVTLLEQNPIVHALLADALERARECDDARVRVLAERMALHRVDAQTWLKACAESTSDAGPQVVYLDPMYPAQRLKRPSGAPALNNSFGLKSDPISAPNTRWDRYLAPLIPCRDGS